MVVELLNLKVARKTVAAEGIAAIELVHPDGAALPPFTAGSHIDVHLPNGLVRQYSLCNNPANSDHYRLGVQRDAQSRGGSISMHDEIYEGDTLTISLPRNSFHLNEDAEYSLLLAGGIGVTPMVAMAYRLAAMDKPFEMHYCTRSPERTAFVDELSGDVFAGRVHFHYDSGPQEQRLDISGPVGRYREGANMYICGPQGFMDYVLGATELAWPTTAFHREYFTSDPKAGHEDDGSFQIKISSTGQIITIPGDQTIVEVLAEQGIDVPVSCEQGVCGTCLTPVLAGEPDHRDVYLSATEQAENNQMTLCCSRANSPMLELDL